MVRRVAALGLAALLVCAQTSSNDVARSRLFDAAPLLHDLQVLSADDMEGRAFGTAGGAKARAYLIDRLSSAGVSPLVPGYTQPVAAGRGAGRPGGANVLGVIRGTGPSDRVIVMSAHYDHVGVRNGVVFNGADDNASGAAALATIGAYFVAHPLTATLVIAAFDGEEQGLLGSRAFLRAKTIDPATILVDVNADMIGRDPANTLFVVGLRRQPFLRSSVERVVAAAPVTLRIGHDDPADAGNDWTRDSDHYAFLEAGVPALYFGVEDYAQLHQPTDDFATMTLPFYVRSVETLIAAIRAFDEDAGEIRQHPAVRP